MIANDFYIVGIKEVTLNSHDINEFIQFYSRLILSLYKIRINLYISIVLRKFIFCLSNETSCLNVPYINIRLSESFIVAIIMKFKSNFTDV